MKSTGFNSWKSWGIAVVCTFVNFLSLLPLRISGLLYVALIDKYKISRPTASRPIIISTTIRTAIGPFTGYLSGVYECRTVIIWGAILSSVGTGACFFAEEIVFITISIGVIYGLGLAFGNTLVPLVIKQHFDKHASKANGLALIGCCLNAIVMPPIFEYFLDTYGLPGALLITSGIMLNGLPAALLLKDPKYKRQPPVRNGVVHETPPPTKSHHHAEPHLFESEKLMTALDLEDIILQSNSLHCSTISLATLDEKSSLVLDDLEYNVVVMKNQKNDDDDDSDDLPESIVLETTVEQKIDEPQPATNESVSCWRRFEVFIDPSYIIILVTQAVQVMILFTAWTIIVDLSRDKGIPSHQELYILMFLPVSEMFGYMGLTWVTDGGYLSSSKFCFCCYLCLAFSCAGLVWAEAFWTLLFTILWFSFFSAAITTIIPVMVFEIMEEKDHAVALASRFMLFGPIGLAMPSLIGFYRENLGSYDGLLYLLGFLSLFSSFLFLLLPYTVACRSRNKNKKSSSSKNKN